MANNPYKENYFKQRRKFIFITFTTCVIISLAVIIIITTNTTHTPIQNPKNQTAGIKNQNSNLKKKIEPQEILPDEVEEDVSQIRTQEPVEEIPSNTNMVSQILEADDPSKNEITNDETEEDRNLIHFKLILKGLAEGGLIKAQSKCLAFAQNCLAKDCSAINGNEWSSRFWIKFFKELNDDIKGAFFIWSGNYLLTPSCKIELKQILDIFGPLQEDLSAAMDRGRKLGLYPGDIREAFDTHKINMIELEKLCQIMEEIRDARYFWGDS